MKRILEIKVEIVEEDEEEIYTTNISAPTLEMVYEKMGAWERSREKDDLLKASELEEDGLAHIEK